MATRSFLTLPLLLIALSITNLLIDGVNAIPTSYANAFVDPNLVLNKTSWNPNSVYAQRAIVSGAHDLALQGPWAVTNKTILPPSNNTHDYLSYAPYWWPDCSNVHNTTELTPQQVNNLCKFVPRDGQFVPDQHAVNNTGDFIALCDSVMYAAMAWAITGDGTHAANVANWIDTWFINNATVQTPNLNFAQLVRGVGMNVGVHTGLLDFKGMARIATGVLILRLGHAAEWTVQVDAGFKNWLTAYLPWVTGSKLALDEKATGNNHGSFFYNQLASIYLILDDKPAAKAVLQEYFNGIFQNQIVATGEQPEEAVRTHPIHYRAYNLAAIITNARLAEYVGYNAWNITTKLGGTIQKATDYAIVQNPLPSNETGAVYEMWQVVSCIASVYGDPTGKYTKFLSGVDPAEAFFFWDYHATVNSSFTSTATVSSSQPTKTATHKGGSSARVPTSFLASIIAFGITGIVSFALC